MPGPPDRDVALAKLLCGVLDDILNPDLLFALVGPLPPPPHPLTIGGATPPWGKLPRDGWATSDIINQAVFCYFSFYFFAIFLDLSRQHFERFRKILHSIFAIFALLFLLLFERRLFHHRGGPLGLGQAPERMSRRLSNGPKLWRGRTLRAGGFVRNRARRGSPR